MLSIRGDAPCLTLRRWPDCLGLSWRTSSNVRQFISCVRPLLQQAAIEAGAVLYITTAGKRLREVPAKLELPADNDWLETVAFCRIEAGGIAFVSETFHPRPDSTPTTAVLFERSKVSQAVQAASALAAIPLPARLLERAIADQVRRLERRG
jgi:hypothetical protein